MRKLTKNTLRAAALIGGLAVATLPAAAQQLPFQPYTGQPSNNTNGPRPFVPYNGSNGQPGPVPFYALPNFSTYTGASNANTNANTNGNPACDRNSRYYNPYRCR
jgi:hypothetical protein